MIQLDIRHGLIHGKRAVQCEYRNSFHEVNAMEISDYCKNVDRELSQWNDKLHHLVDQMDSMPTGAKQRVYEEVNGLHILMTEMDDRIQQLRSECSVSWEPQASEPTPTIAGTSKRFNDASDIHFDYEFGG